MSSKPLLLAIWIAAICSASETFGQESSLFNRAPQQMASPDGLTLRNSSWTYAPPQTARVLKLHDIVSIRVDELSRGMAEGT
ncbi:MAG: hypothetical protein JNK90_12630, partial [Planctomycetaceae bacterium]|nr:hypothetical protein [Planctomycetaceae bacterium]